MNNNIKEWIDLYYKKIPSETNVKLKVLSGSMMPYLVPGKNIEIKPYSGQKISIGDILIFKKKSKLFSHRVIFIINILNLYYLYEKGDVNAIGSWIKKDDIRGIVISAEDENGHLINYACKDVSKNLKWIAVKNIFKIFTHFVKKVIKKIGLFFKMLYN